MRALIGFRHWSRLFAVSIALGLAACSSSGTGNVASTGSAECVPGDSSTAAECGRVVIALTDAEGEFTSYTVDVLSIALDRADGERIEMLPRSTRVDFAQLTSLSELISESLVAPGDFTGGRIRIDYGDAEIFVESGGAIVPAQVFDARGTLLTAATDDSVVDVGITLPSTEHLLVRRGRTSLLSVDFDLASSHLVDLTMDPARVIAQPYLVAEIAPVDQKEIRVRGALADVDLDNGTYDIRLRPWFHRFGDYGALTVNTHPETQFEIDGTGYVGTEGLRALAGLTTGTVTVAFGTLDSNDRSFTADVVHAGDSVGGDRYAAVEGNIVSRRGDRLIMKGAVVIRRDRRAHFHRTIVVEIGPDTKVTRIGDWSRDFDKDDLSVGQRTTVLGTFFNSDVVDSDPFGPDVALVLDATQGHARMLVTRLTGTVNQVMPGQINLTLRAIDRLGVDLFDFAGTGLSVELDADPRDYEVSTSSLALDSVTSLGTIEALHPVRVLGFVAPFGAAPPDFEGRALVGPRDLPTTLGVGWGSEGTASPFAVMGPTSLVIDLDNPDIGLRHHLLIGDRLIDLFDLAASPSINESEVPRVYGIWEPGHIELFKDFADFADELALRLSATDRARSFAAYGRYQDDQNTLIANKVVVHMLPAESP